METTEDQYKTLLKLFLPEELFRYFTIINLQVIADEVHVYIEENNDKPKELQDKNLISKGFHSSVTIQDFPLRDKPVFLHVRRRRWLDEDTGQVVSRDWNAVAKGTRLTKEFATFLKGILGYLPDKQ